MRTSLISIVHFALRLAFDIAISAGILPMMEDAVSLKAQVAATAHALYAAVPMAQKRATRADKLTRLVLISIGSPRRTPTFVFRNYILPFHRKPITLRS